MLELTLRSTAILAAAWLLVSALGRATAATRHLVWQLAIIAVLLAPIIAPITPKYILPGIAALVQGVQRVQGVQSGATGATGSPGTAPAGSAAASARAAPLAPSAPLEPLAPLAPGARSAGLGELAALARVIGTVGTLVVSLWFVIGWILTSVTVRRATAAPLEWQLELNALRERLRITRDVRLGILFEAGSPLATGVWRPAILLPASSMAWSAECRRAVLLHELAHVRRADCRGQLVTQMACALHWFNPLIWRAARRMRAERERACDDEVLRAGARPSTYASHLLDIACQLRPVLRPSAALAMARPSELEGRLLAVLAETHARVPVRGSRWAVAATVSAVTALALGATAMARPQPQPAAPGHGASGVYSVPDDVVSRANQRAAAAKRSQAETVLQRSPDARKRRQAVLDLADAGQADAIRPLRAALNDPSSDVRERAALGLAFMSGREVVPALLEALTHRDSQVREKAAIGLALRRDERAIEPLIAALSDPDSQVREKAAIALGTSGDSRAGGALTRALQDPDAQVREQAATGLMLLGLTR